MTVYDLITILFQTGSAVGMVYPKCMESRYEANMEYIGLTLIGGILWFAVLYVVIKMAIDDSKNTKKIDEILRLLKKAE